MNRREFIVGATAAGLMPAAVAEEVPAGIKVRFLGTVAHTVRVLQKTERYLPKPGQKVYLTHMARTMHGTQAEVEKAVPAPLCPAYDGLEVVF